MIKYIVQGNKWFDKVNGNTYHSVNITDIQTNKLIFSSGLCYGYGEQYRQTALSGLIKLGLLSESDRHNHELIRDTLFFSVNDKAKKRDLKQMVI